MSAASDEKRNSRLQEAREQGELIPLPPKARHTRINVYIALRDVPYRRRDSDEEVVIGIWDPETDLFLPNERYPLYFDPGTLEQGRRCVTVVPIPDGALINLEGAVFLALKDSPRRDCRSLGGYAWIGKILEEETIEAIEGLRAKQPGPVYEAPSSDRDEAYFRFTYDLRAVPEDAPLYMCMEKQADYDRYAAPDSGVPCPIVKIPVDADGLLPVPDCATLYRGRYYRCSLHGSVHPYLRTRSGFAKIGYPCGREGLMKPGEDYASVFIEGAPIADDLFPSYGTVTKEQRLKKWNERYDSFTYDIDAGYSYIAERYFESTGITALLEKHYGRQLAARIRSIAAGYAQYEPGIIDASDICISIFTRVLRSFQEPRTLYRTLSAVSDIGTDAFWSDLCATVDEAQPLTAISAFEDWEQVNSGLPTGLFYSPYRDGVVRYNPCVCFWDPAKERIVFRTDGMRPGESLGLDLTGPFSQLLKIVERTGLGDRVRDLWFDMREDGMYIDKSSFPASCRVTVAVSPIDPNLQEAMKTARARLLRMLPEDYYLGEYITEVPCSFEGLRGKLVVSLHEALRAYYMDNKTELLRQYKRVLSKMRYAAALRTLYSRFFEISPGEDDDGDDHFRSRTTLVRASAAGKKNYDNSMGFYSIFTTDTAADKKELWQRLNILEELPVYSELSFDVREYAEYDMDMMEIGEGMSLAAALGYSLCSYLKPRLVQCGVGDIEWNKSKKLGVLSYLRVRWNSGSPDFEEFEHMDPRKKQLREELLEVFGVTREELLAYAKELYATPKYFDYTDDPEDVCDDWVREMIGNSSRKRDRNLR